MTVLVVLWLFTSSYAIPLGTFPDGKTCAMSAVGTDIQFKGQGRPKPFLYRLACVPSLSSARIAPPSRMGLAS